MNENFILTNDNVFSKSECDNIISLFKNNFLFSDIQKYHYLNIENKNDFPYLKKLYDVLNLYKTRYPEIDSTSSFWNLDNLRLKCFKNGNSFSNWHSEHSFTASKRVLNLQLYLTDHNCGTEFFYNKKTILSKVGRVAIFPAYFTHTHRGQSCPLQKDRYILTAYVSFYKKGQNE